MGLGGKGGVVGWGGSEQGLRVCGNVGLNRFVRWGVICGTQGGGSGRKACRGVGGGEGAFAFLDFISKVGWGTGWTLAVSD